jgi:large subunit ribosomal protein L10
MALTRDQKKAQVADLTKKMQNASSVIFAQYLGLTVGNITKLRSNLRKEKAEMQVAKKTLIQIAAKDAKLPEVADGTLPGGVACIFSTTEPTAGAAVAFKFAKDHPQVKLVGGIFDGKILTAAEANALATIPSRLQLLGIFMSMCSAPLVQFASACSSPLTGFARALSEIAKKKEVAAPPAAAPVVEAASAPAAETPAAPIAA